MIKVMNLVAILIAPLAIRQISWGTRGMIVLACAIILGLSVLFSKRGSIVVEEEPVAAAKAETSRAH